MALIHVSTSRARHILQPDVLCPDHSRYWCADLGYSNVYMSFVDFSSPQMWEIIAPAGRMRLWFAIFGIFPSERVAYFLLLYALSVLKAVNWRTAQRPPSFFRIYSPHVNCSIRLLYVGHASNTSPTSYMDVTGPVGPYICVWSPMSRSPLDTSVSTRNRASAPTPLSRLDTRKRNGCLTCR